MTPTTVSAILQLDYPDRLPMGHRNEPAFHRVTYANHVLMRRARRRRPRRRPLTVTSITCACD